MKYSSDAICDMLIRSVSVSTSRREPEMEREEFVGGGFRMQRPRIGVDRGPLFFAARSHSLPGRRKGLKKYEFIVSGSTDIQGFVYLRNDCRELFSLFSHLSLPSRIFAGFHPPLVPSILASGLSLPSVLWASPPSITLNISKMLP